MRATVLVVAKAPVPGRAKTRLAATVGDERAADLAAAMLLDTLDAAYGVAGPEACVVALAGDLASAARQPELRAALARCRVVAQHGHGLGERLASAHEDAGAGALGDGGGGPVVQIGTDTPQVTSGLLDAVLAGLADHDAVLGPAPDGGWWVLALRDPAHARVLREVAMSTPTTHDETRAALVGAGLRVVAAPGLRDVDDLADAEVVAALAPATRFARSWAAVATVATAPTGPTGPTAPTAPTVARAEAGA